AEAAAEVFPVDAQITVCAPSSFAFATASTMPRSLNDPVGFNPSNLACSSMPSSSDSFSNLINGVFPSYKVSSGVFSFTGNYSLYSFKTPCQVIIIQLHLFYTPQPGRMYLEFFAVHLRLFLRFLKQILLYLSLQTEYPVMINMIPLQTAIR